MRVLTITGVLVLSLAGLYLLASYYLFGFTVMCQDDGDTSDCDDFMAQALTPAVLGVLAAILWVVGLVRRSRPDAVAWAVAGLVIALLPVAYVALLALG